jgi:hypothetical protein
MRWIVVLTTLICLLGVGAGQTIFGGGYSSYQMTFFDQNDMYPFDNFVQSYWNSYIRDVNVTSATGPAATMNIWLNSFPLEFSYPLRVGASSFAANTTGFSGISNAEVNSVMINREVKDNFNLDQSWRYLPTGNTLSLAKGESTSVADSRGQILSQGIMTSFS